MKVINAMTCLFVPKHEVLFRIGDRGRHVYICISGRSQLFITNPARATLKSQKKELEEQLFEFNESLKQMRMKQIIQNPLSMAIIYSKVEEIEQKKKELDSVNK